MTVGGFDLVWLPGLGKAPGGVDIISVGPDGGTTARAVTLNDARGLAVLLSMTTGCSDFLSDLAQIVPHVALARVPVSSGIGEAS